jgi:hypothetical protein
MISEISTTTKVESSRETCSARANYTQKIFTTSGGTVPGQEQGSPATNKDIAIRAGTNLLMQQLPEPHFVMTTSRSTSKPATIDPYRDLPPIKVSPAGPYSPVLFSMIFKTNKTSIFKQVLQLHLRQHPSRR